MGPRSPFVGGGGGPSSPFVHAGMGPRSSLVGGVAPLRFSCAMVRGCSSSWSSSSFEGEGGGSSFMFAGARHCSWVPVGGRHCLCHVRCVCGCSSLLMGACGRSSPFVLAVVVVGDGFVWRQLLMTDEATVVR